MRKHKPKEILECGTGVSTIVMAYALKENQQEGFNKARITSMEEREDYYKMAMTLLPGEYRNTVEIFLSPTEETGYSLFRGMKYKNIPGRKYDFVFVDGPLYLNQKDSFYTFDADFIEIVKNADWPIDAIVDKRVSTCFILQKVLGTKKVKYDALRHLGFCHHCTAGDLKDFVPSMPSSSFQKSFSLFGSSRLDLNYDSAFLKNKESV
jgi:hypothetical protein